LFCCKEEEVMAIIQKRYAHLNQADSGSLHRKLDATSAYITGSLEAASTLTVRGEAQFDDLAKFGDTTAAIAGLPGAVPNLDLAVSGSAVVGDTFMVLGFVQAGADLEVAGEAHVDGNLEVVGEITGSAPALLQSTLKVDGQADMVDVLPQLDLTYDLGSAALRWAELHAGTAAFTNLEADYLDVAVTASVAQLTGSAGAVFSAGDVLVQAGKVSASLNLEAGGQLVVAGNADLNGQLDVFGQSDLHGAVIAHGTMNVQGAADLDSTLNVDGIAEFQDDVFAKADLNVSGALEVALTANVAGNFSVATNKFTVAASSGDAAFAGDVTVSGDLVVLGDRVEAQVQQLVIEDGLITLMSGSPNRTASNESGIEIEVGGVGEMPAIKFANALGGASGSWVSNLDWIPSEDLKYDLGIASKRWRELNLSGDANVGGALDVAGAASVGALDASSLAVAGAATFAAGIAVTGTGSFSGDLSAASGSFSGDVSVVGALDAASADIAGLVQAGSLSVTGLSDLAEIQVSGPATFAQGIAVTGTGSFSGDLSAVSASFGGDLAVTGVSTFGDLATFNGGATVPAGETLTIAAGATLDVLGTANYVNLSATGNGTFGGNVVVTGSLTVGGINMSPIASTSPVSTVDGGSATMLTQTLASGDMAKFEVEVIARGGSNAATWKISVAALHDGTNIQAAATELSKEFFGSLGANLDVDIDVSGNNVLVKAKGAASAGTVYWDCQVIKKMVMDSSDGSRKY
jgi:cytoskeletal protein CcmA (bactofilin family)